MNNGVRYCALEGGAGSGKTTLLYGIKDIDNIIPDYMELLNSNITNRLISLSREDNIKLFIDVENIRNRLYQTKASSFVLYDRSFLTIIAFQYAISKINNEQLPENFKSILSDDRIVFPDYVVYLKTELSDRKLRLKKRRGDTAKIFYDEKFNYYNERFFELLKTKQPDYIDFINTTKHSEKEAAVLAKDYLNKASVSFERKEDLINTIFETLST